MRAIEKRVRKLEAVMGGAPCDKPGHSDFMLFVAKSYEKDISAEDQAKIDSVRACVKCKDKPVVILTHFDPDYETQTVEPLRFIFGEKPEPAPRVVPAPWLNGILTIGDD